VFRPGKVQFYGIKETSKYSLYLLTDVYFAERGRIPFIKKDEEDINPNK